jgi:hypothetical protein
MTTTTTSVHSQLNRWLLFAMLAGFAGAHVCLASQTESILPGDDIQARVNRAAPGTTFLLKPGMHRMPSIVPRHGDTFAGEAGTVLSGARPVTALSRSGSYWVATALQVRRAMGEAPCRSGCPRCNYPEDLFLDDVPLLHVAKLSDLGPGKWHFDYEANQIYLWDDPTGRNVELSVTPKAFSGTATNVTIRNLIIEKYANPTQQATVELGTGWVIEDSEIRWTMSFTTSPTRPPFFQGLAVSHGPFHQAVRVHQAKTAPGWDHRL